MAQSKRKRKTPPKPPVSQSVQILNQVLKRNKLMIAFDAVVVLSGVSILQWHGIFFWIQQIGVVTGVWLSVLLELMSFWCWFRKDTRRMRQGLIKALAVGFTVLLLVGPLHEVGADKLTGLMGGVQGRVQFEIERNRKTQEISEKKAAAARLLVIIEKSGDGYVTYNKRIEEIDRLNKELDSLHPPVVETALPFLTLLVISMQALAILLVQIVVVLAILDLSPRVHREKKPEGFVLSILRTWLEPKPIVVQGRSELDVRSYHELEDLKKTKEKNYIIEENKGD